MSSIDPLKCIFLLLQTQSTHGPAIFKQPGWTDDAFAVRRESFSGGTAVRMAGDRERGEKKKISSNLATNTKGGDLSRKHWQQYQKIGQGKTGH